ncbi:MAG: hypothetical protein J4O14_07780 [Chloroflexi bacterium]|nr:hypothetical protein [Chloroflexota bacterium]MCI0820229.1 hypothetical protein [Chloroflexota bacterium]MCI0839708.1 hypothetical protein [Chloroflexota bacterium]
MIGFVVGPASLLVGVFVGSIVGGLIAATLIVARLKNRRDYVPHGPHLANGRRDCAVSGRGAVGHRQRLATPRLP